MKWICWEAIFLRSPRGSEPHANTAVPIEFVHARASESERMACRVPIAGPASARIKSVGRLMDIKTWSLSSFLQTVAIDLYPRWMGGVGLDDLFPVEWFIAEVAINLGSER